MKDSMIPAETIQKAIYLLRGQNVILDRDFSCNVWCSYEGAQAGGKAKRITFSL